MTVWPRIDPSAQPSQLQPADLWMKHKHFSMWNVYNAQCFQSNPELLPLISFKFRALRAFPAPHMFLNRTNANPRIFPSVIRKCFKNELFLSQDLNRKVCLLINEKKYFFFTRFEWNIDLKNRSKFRAYILQIILGALKHMTCHALLLKQKVKGSFRGNDIVNLVSEVIPENWDSLWWVSIWVGSSWSLWSSLYFSLVLRLAL